MNCIFFYSKSQNNLLHIVKVIWEDTNIANVPQIMHNMAGKQCNKLMFALCSSKS